MKWTYETYLAKCLETWGGEHRKERALLGIIGELGECVDKYKKWLRGDYVGTGIKEDGSRVTPEQRFNRDMMLELGDVYYYATVASSEIEEDIVDNVFSYCPIYNKKISIFELVKMIIDNVCNVRNGKGFNEIQFTIGYINHIAKLFGLDIDKILDMNIAKLTSRKERGVINGNGDNR